MNLIQLNEAIESKVNEINEIRKWIRAEGEKSAEAEGNYDKAIAVTLMKLHNDVEFELDGQKIKSPPVSIMEKAAKGICYNEKIEMEKALNIFRAAISNLNACQSQLTAYQSIYKRQDSI